MEVSIWAVTEKKINETKEFKRSRNIFCRFSAWHLCKWALYLNQNLFSFFSYFFFILFFLLLHYLYTPVRLTTSLHFPLSICVYISSLCFSSTYRNRHTWSRAKFFYFFDFFFPSLYFALSVCFRLNVWNSPS